MINYFCLVTSSLGGQLSLVAQRCFDSLFIVTQPYVFYVQYYTYIDPSKTAVNHSKEIIKEITDTVLNLDMPEREENPTGSGVSEYIYLADGVEGVC